MYWEDNASCFNWVCLLCMQFAPTGICL